MKESSLLARVLGAKPIWMKWLLISVIVIGIFFRFANLDAKFYWTDEVLTSLTISGYTSSELLYRLSNGQTITPQELQVYQNIIPSHGLIKVISSLAIDYPEHPPLYYAILRLWADVFGDSIIAIRGLSATLSLLVFPAVYWLCLELFGIPLIGWCAITLLSISPFHILYAQEAREYSFWTAAILLSSAALLKALRQQTKLSWGIFAATVALQLYIYPFSLYLLVSYGIYLIVIERFRITRKLIAFTTSAAIGILCFSPWLAVIALRYGEIRHRLNWMKGSSGLLFMMQRWAANFCHLFVSLTSYMNISWKTYLFLIPAAILLIALVGYAFYFLFRQVQKSVWLFILVLTLPIPVILLGQDIISGSYSSTIARYLTPTFLGIQLVVAYLFANKLVALPISQFSRNSWKIALICVFSCGVLSAAISSNEKLWWNKNLDSIDLIETARFVNQKENSLLLLASDSSTPDYPSFLALSHEITSKSQLQPWILNRSVLVPPSTINSFEHVLVLSGNRDADIYHYIQEQNRTVDWLYLGRRRSLWKLK